MATKWDGSLCCFIVCQLGLSPMVFGNFCHFLSISKYSALNCVEFYSNIENPPESRKKTLKCYLDNFVSRINIGEGGA